MDPLLPIITGSIMGNNGAHYYPLLTSPTSHHKGSTRRLCFLWKYFPCLVERYSASGVFKQWQASWIDTQSIGWCKLGSALKLTKSCVVVTFGQTTLQESKINHPSQNEQGWNRPDWQIKADRICWMQEVHRLCWDQWHERYTYGGRRVSKGLDTLK